MDGSTLDLSSRSTTLNALSASTRGLANLAFAANATVGVSLGTRHASSAEPLMSWTAATKPANIDTVSFVRTDADRQYSLVLRENGLYAQVGLTIMFR
jgi:ethanolamine utilization microcompartment shell protein EutL